jgi:hypothetical protein
VLNLNGDKQWCRFCDTWHAAFEIHDCEPAAMRRYVVALDSRAASAECTIVYLKIHVEALESVVRRLQALDWCLGYDLTEAQHVELDSIRDAAYRILPCRDERKIRGTDHVPAKDGAEV